MWILGSGTITIKPTTFYLPFNRLKFTVASNGWTVYSISGTTETLVGSIGQSGTLTGNGYFVQTSNATTLVDMYIDVIEGTLLPTTTDNAWEINSSALSFSKLRDDVVSQYLKLTPTPIGSSTPTGWLVSSTIGGVVGYLPQNGTLSTRYFTLVAAFATADISTFLIKITADDFVLWNAQDAVLLNSMVADTVRLPATTETLEVDKRTSDFLEFNLTYDSVTASAIPDISALAPSTIDSAFIQTYTGTSDYSLSTTSPEVDQLRNWIPITLLSKDSSTSVAEFSDAASLFELYSAASGIHIASIYPTTSSSTYPITLDWNTAFFNEYLPLNTNANVVVYGSGFNERLNVRMAESLQLIEDGGVLTTDALLRDSVSVGIVEGNSWQISMNEVDQFSTIILDDPFIGFIPGYGNLAFDAEVAAGSYDVGIPLTAHFHEARRLAGLDALTVNESSQSASAREARLAAVLGLISNFLNNNDLGSTTLAQFLGNIQAYLTAHPNDPLETSSFGYPLQGLGININIGSAGATASNPSTENSTASVSDTMAIIASDTPITWDSFPFDARPFDTVADTFVTFTTELPPVPASVGPLTTYEAFDTPLYAIGQIHRIDLVFTSAYFLNNLRLSWSRPIRQPDVNCWRRHRLNNSLI
jgi:hypothetical protein